jgi:hypothetical protein
MAPDNMKKDLSEIQRYRKSCETEFWQNILRAELEYLLSLQFIEDWRGAVVQATRVLRDGGRLIVMPLNPTSAFFQEKLRDRHSYVRKIRHLDVKRIEEAISRQFTVQTEYFLGVKDAALFESREPADAVLHVIHGVRKEPGA